ncbi:type IV secretory system conjugative DNA transfer family protein [Candidatus Peregrinibacteria bacterium]|jgi:hypothetical protein|nr:type IV secretory system conjugative DNA transfer family protein [Candidatus Peregrinibacteria bacterium]MBT7483260.1 type IV secretory system conjugative DNA transfer family protein [Candidatus Peregrinibacteria bacterium]MBT7703367.1 type IV secretory system conjugative DNA transfer family protein [Candidatus Peregrinibacteria bacterium]
MTQKQHLLLVKIPPGKNEEASFEQMLENIYETMNNASVAFEVVSMHQHIYFYVRVATRVKHLIEGQLYGQYPDAEIFEVKDYVKPEELNAANKGFACAEIVLERSDIYPIKNYHQFEGDSLAGIFSVLSKGGDGEEIWIQVVGKPMQDNWQLNFKRRVKMRVLSLKNIFRLGDYLKLKGKTALRASEKEEFNKKADKNSYNTNIRVAYIAKTQGEADMKIESVKRAFQQFNTTDYNSLKGIKVGRNAFLRKYQEGTLDGGVLFTTEELATLYHFPEPDTVPHIVHVVSRKKEPPESLPKDGNVPPNELSVFAATNYHNQNIRFGIKRIDRRRHLYVVGKSGTGKSKMLELLINADIQAGKGVGVLDPHGDLVDNILKYIPEHRIDDVILFDPGDVDYPIAFNPLAGVEPAYRIRVTIGFVEIFKKLFGANWTPRLEHVLRYTTLALLDTPNTTVLSILKMLSDKNYRQKVVANIEDSVIKNFWVNEFAGWSEKFDNEAIMPLLNKVGQFVSTNLIRNIVGQAENKIDIRDIMDNQKILLMKISKGKLGEENCGLIGAMMVTKIQQAAMQRSDTPEELRKDFYLYCDEFQYFATQTFAEILSEARKYRLNLTMAHQYMGQLSDLVKTTVFGNVGSIINFRVGAEDAVMLEKEYTPKFEVRDIINLGVRELYLKMSVDGEIKDAFSGRTVDVPVVTNDFTEQIIAASRRKYCSPRSEVEQTLKAWQENASAEPDEDSGPQAGEEKFATPIV